MVYYNKKDYTFKGFKKATAKNKMYSAILQNKKTKKEIIINFGDNKMGNYQDRTGLNAYPQLIHGDKERRKRYRARHAVYLKEGFYSPSYFSWLYLW